MKTLKTFLTESPKIQPLDWKSAFEMCLIFSIDKIGRESYSQIFNIRKGYGKYIGGAQDEAIYNWEMGEGQEDDREYDDSHEWWMEEGWEEVIEPLGTITGYNEGDWAPYIKDLKLPAKMWFDKNKDHVPYNFAWEDDYPDIPGPEFNDWFPYFIGMDDGGKRGSWNSADGFNHLQLKVKGKGEEFLREVTKKFNTDWKMIDQNKMATEVASIMVEGPLKVTPQSAISKLMLNPTKFNVNGIDKAEWGKFVKKPFTHDREWMRGLEKQFKKYIG